MFRQETYKWAECDYCSYETPKDNTNKDRYLKLYLSHLRVEHPSATGEIGDLEALLSPFEPYKVIT